MRNLDFPHHLVAQAEVEQDPEFDPAATHIHRDGKQCRCPAECVEYLEREYYPARERERLAKMKAPY